MYKPKKCNILGHIFFIIIISKLEQAILDRIKSYTTAIYSGDIEQMINCLHSPSLAEWHQNFLIMLEMMEPFGEHQNFLKRFPFVDSIEAFKEIDTRQFSHHLFKNTVIKMDKTKVIDFVLSIKIDKMEPVETDKVFVHYTYNNVFYDGSPSSQQLEMIQEDGQWFILIKSGFEAVLKHYQQEIEHYEARKKRDCVEETFEDEDYESFAIYGFRHMETEEVIIEPRFKAVGDFGEGLAPVKIFTRFGYIDTKGELVIAPEYVRANPFSEGLAAVSMEVGDDFEMRYGYIDKNGQWVIQPKFKEASIFQEGLAAVKQGEHWGFIDKAGIAQTPFEYRWTELFENGEAEVGIVDKDGYTIGFVIDRKGKVLRKVSEEEEGDDEDW